MVPDFRARFRDGRVGAEWSGTRLMERMGRTRAKGCPSWVSAGCPRRCTKISLQGAACARSMHAHVRGLQAAGSDFGRILAGLFFAARNPDLKIGFFHDAHGF